MENDQLRYHANRSSSSSSSSSSVLSSSYSNFGPYETPLTASLGQHEHVIKQERASGEPGYPFPSIVAVADLPESAKRDTTRRGSDDLWKHTDDLLGPSSQTSIGHSVSKVGASALAPPRPGLQTDTGDQHASASHATTPTGVDMDRRESQSSCTSSCSDNQPKSASSESKGTGPSVVAQSNAMTTLPKLSTSSPPAGSNGTAGFSPLSPLVQPFSPSANAATLPNKLNSLSKATAAQTSNGRTSKVQPVPSVSGNMERPLVSQTPSDDAEYVQRRRASQDAQLESPTTSSNEPAFYSGYIPPASRSFMQNSSDPSDMLRSAETPDVYRRGGMLERRESVEPNRQCFWNEDEGLAMPSAPVPQGGNRFNPMGAPLSASQGHWDHTQQTNEDHFLYEDPRSGRHTGSFAEPVTASHPMYHPRMSAATQRRLPAVRAADNFDASLYGYGPPSVSDASTAGTEDICTIFVVGFPEDIQEREFQNMFLFARGFEAATLKIPASTAAARERDAAAAAAVSAIAATLPAFSAPPPPPALDPKHGFGSGMSPAGGSSYDHLNNSLYEETFHAAAMGGTSSAPHGQVENAQRVSSALAAAALTATASTASLANTTNKKQIIGFAKFRSRDDAMIARDVLSGRKIDPEKGCVLKAEMAKKNLHVKKSGTEIQGSSLSSLALEANLPAQKEGASALDRLAERERQREWNVRMTNVADARQHDPHRPGATENWERLAELQHEAISRKPIWPNTAYDAFHSVLPNEDSRFDATGRRYSSASVANLAEVEHRDSGQSLLPTQRSAASTATRQTIPQGTSNFGKNLLQQLDDAEDSSFPLPEPMPGFGAAAYALRSVEQGGRRQPPPAVLPTTAPNVAVGSLGGHTYLDEDYRKLAVNSYQDDEQQQTSQKAQQSLVGQSYSQFAGGNATTPTSATAALGTGTRRLTSPELVSPAFTEFRQPRTQNRADDNMPISTLYVGGLPSSLPSLPGSASASQLEDALRNVFGRCPGFRRMSYRHKSQGPMCFIEFDDTQHATRALNEIYGHTLGGLVKGGIRLAYSKNPLGVRGSGSNGPDSPTPLSPGYFASDVYGQSGYYDAPSSGPSHGQIPTPTLGPRAAQYDQGPNYARTFTEYSSSSAAQQGFHLNQQVYQTRPSHMQQTVEHRRTLDRRATSPQSGSGSAFSPFALQP